MSPDAGDRLERWIAWFDAGLAAAGLEQVSDGDGILMMSLWEKGYEPPARAWDPQWGSGWWQEAARTPHSHECPTCSVVFQCQDFCIVYGPAGTRSHGRYCAACRPADSSVPRRQVDETP